MRWYHAVLIALALVVGGLLSGGLYSFHMNSDSSELVRFNRVTGSVEVYIVQEGAVLWIRFPNGSASPTGIEKLRAANPGLREHRATAPKSSDR